MNDRGLRAKYPMKNDPGTLIRELTSTIRTMVDDLLTDLAETEDARRSADAKMYPPAGLPTPDATNPAHLQWTARMIELAQPGGDLPYRASQRNILAEHLRADADRLEAAQQQAEVDEVAVTKVVEELTLAGIGNDTPSDYYEIAVEGALIAAGLLQGGAEQDDVEEESRRGISNGQLLAMGPERRAEVIASLSPEVRRKLANIASLGASRLISQVIAEKDDWRAGPRLASAREFTDLVAGLLQGGDEK